MWNLVVNAISCRLVGLAGAKPCEPEGRALRAKRRAGPPNGGVRPLTSAAHQVNVKVVQTNLPSFEPDSMGKNLAAESRAKRLAHPDQSVHMNRR
jgi:hypothetical protein